MDLEGLLVWCGVFITVALVVVAVMEIKFQQHMRAMCHNEFLEESARVYYESLHWQTVNRERYEQLIQTYVRNHGFAQWKDQFNPKIHNWRKEGF